MTRTILVNKDNPIKNNYLKKVELIDIKNIDGENIKIEKEAYEHFLKLQKFLNSIELEIGISSAFRSIEDQQNIMNYYLEKYGSDYCNEFVAPPSFSEHHTGLAIDFYVKAGDEYPKDDPKVYKDLSYYKTVEKYLKNFGFILRYPEDKKVITGYSYEPWHIRYVGKFVATIIYDNNLTLEEYVNNFNGLIAVNKKRGMTSFDVVNRISHLFGIKRVGHTGTLDPIAEGVLIVAIGKATKIVELVTSKNKEYIADVLLGIRTDSRDITGKVIARTDNIDTTNLNEIINNFKKTYMQEVPIYSAVKVNGKKLYEYARNNESIELPKKEVTIEQLEIIDRKDDEFRIKTTVSKGTYIRSLIDDIGEQLGCHATMKSLTRTSLAAINIEETSTLEEIEAGNYKLLSVEYVLDYPIEVVDKSLEKKIVNGQRIINSFNIADKVIFKNKDNKLLGIYEKDGNELKVWKNF